MDIYHTKKQTQNIPRPCSYLLLKTLFYFISQLIFTHFLPNPQKKQNYQHGNIPTSDVNREENLTIHVYNKKQSIYVLIVSLKLSPALNETKIFAFFT